MTLKELKEIMPMHYIPNAKRTAPMKHEESDEQLAHCTRVKREHGSLLHFIRHERERKRGMLDRNLISVYNSIDAMPDFEQFFADGRRLDRFYIEWKKPGEEWQKNGRVKARYNHQYICHRLLWRAGHFAYFCNDKAIAWELHLAWLEGNPLPMQEYLFDDPAGLITIGNTDIFDL